MKDNTPEKEEFAKLSVKRDIKHEIDVIAAIERRFVYEVVEDMLKLYKEITIKKSPRSNKKNSRPISDVVANYRIDDTSLT
jgi:hypothetical protein